MNTEPTSGIPHVLIVEDEATHFLLLQEMLTNLGYEVIGPAQDLETALRMARTASIDLAFLDVNLEGQNSLAVARALLDRRVPFAFATGYDTSELPEPFSLVPTLMKPYTPGDLNRTLARLAEPSPFAD